MYWLISLYLNSYNFTHMTLRIFVLSVLLTWVTLCDNILIILDNALLKQTHSQLIELLQSTHNVEIAYTFGKTKIELKTYDRFKYHHVIVMGLSAKGIYTLIKNLLVKLKLMISYLTLIKGEMLSLLGILILKNHLESFSMLLESSLMNM